MAQELDAAEAQLQLLQQAQHKTAVYQHDMRHHLNAIDAYLSAGEPGKAKTYIQKVRADIASITPTRFCENELVNLICSSFSQKAAESGITLSVDASLPLGLAISETELCSILSNGLENALRAASMAETSPRSISFFCTIRQNSLLLQITNPYSGAVHMQDGLPVSSCSGHGYGCRSIRTIVERYHGLCDFHAEAGLFTLRIVIPNAAAC